MIFKPATLRPMFGRILSIAMALICGAGVVGFIATGDLTGLVRYSWILLFVIAVTFAMFWFPRLDILEHEITVKNVLSTVHVPWPAIERIDTKYALTLYTPKGKVTAWASPAPNRYASTRITRGDVSALSESAYGPGRSVRPGDSLTSESGVAAQIIRARWEQLRDDGLLDNPKIDESAFRRDIHWSTIAVLAALLAATVLGLVL
jgi:hypothetical protein